MASPRRLFFTLSIRKLIVALIAANIAVLILIGGAGRFTNDRFDESQTHLIEISEIQSNRAEILVALQSFLTRQRELMAVTETSALSAFPDRTALETEVRQAVGALTQSLSKSVRHSADTDAALRQLAEAFQEMLGADSKVFATTKDILTLGEERAALQSKLETGFTAFESKVDSLEDEVGFLVLQAQISLKKLARQGGEADPAQLVAAYREASARLLSDETRRVTHLARQLHVQSANLAALAGTLVTSQDASELVSVRDNRLIPLIEQIRVSIGQMASIDTASDSKKLAAEIAGDLERLAKQLVDGAGSLAGLTGSLIASSANRAEAVARQEAATLRMTSSLDAMKHITDEAEMRVTQDSRSLLSRVQNGMLSLDLVTILVVLVLGLGIARLVLRPLDRVIAALEEIGQGDGDLTRRLEPAQVREIELLATAFNQFAEKVAVLVGKVAEASQRVHAHTTRSASLSGALSDQIAQHRTETDSVATGVSQLSSSIAIVAENGEQAAHLAQEAHERAAGAQAVVDGSRVSIEALATDIEEATRSLDAFGRDTQRVSRVLEVINDIAGQTNLLALNAAIEAARAGEAGRGFAVVADEVRSLASKTQESTVEIAAILDRLRGGSEAVIQTMGASQRQVSSVVEQSNQVTESFQGIASAIQSIDQMNREISGAVSTQFQATESIEEQVRRIRTNTASTAEAAELVARMSAELAELDHELQQMIGQFKLGG